MQFKIFTGTTSRSNELEKEMNRWVSEKGSRIKVESVLQSSHYAIAPHYESRIEITICYSEVSSQNQ
jgi:hypothetical protein